MDLTIEEIDALIECFENESLRRYGRCNYDAPLYRKLKETKSLLTTPKEKAPVGKKCGLSLIYYHPSQAPNCIKGECEIWDGKRNQCGLKFSDYTMLQDIVNHPA